ncbi:MAG: hypothetical protein BIFFINMI_00246 [Phycisphaerae bacterium]|nr:hypothetical protein [Phycisphaerae bacterium]
MQWLPYLSRYIHVLMAVLAVGGLFFLWRVTLPALAAAGESEAAAAARRLVVRRWRMILWHAIVLLLVTGVYNAYLNWPPRGAPGGPTWHMLFGIKMILAGGLFVIGIALTWPGQGPAFFKRRAGLFIRVNVVLALAVVALASAMKMLH